jgi:hypothetical protein
MKNALFLLLAAAVVLLNLGCNKDDDNLLGESEVNLEITGAEVVSISEVLDGTNNYGINSTFDASTGLLTIGITRFPEFTIIFRGVKTGNFGKGTYSFSADNASTYGNNFYAATSGKIEVTNFQNWVGAALGTPTYLANVDVDVTMANVNDPSSTLRIQGSVLRFLVVGQ